MRTKLEYDSEEGRCTSVRTAREFPSFLVLLPLPPVILGPGKRVGQEWEQASVPAVFMAQEE